VSADIGETIMIDSQQASEALMDIDQIVRRVRQSQIYNLASLIMILWGVLVFAGNIATWLWPWEGYYLWISVDVVGVLGTLATSAFTYPSTGVRTFDVRVLVAYLLFLAFGYFCSTLGHFTPREQGTFWPIYFMLFYSIAGLWFGYAFIAIGIGISALTLVGYVYIGAAFPLWMAFVNGGGLILGGLWMRRI
jgi:hypothetical protein